MEEHPEYTDTDLRKELFLRFYHDDFNEEQKNKIVQHLVEPKNTTGQTEKPYDK